MYRDRNEYIINLKKRLIGSLLAYFHSIINRWRFFLYLAVNENEIYSTSETMYNSETLI